MPQTKILKKHITGVVLGALTLGVATQANSADVNMFDGEWHASVTPYLWLPGISGSSTFKGPFGNAQSVNTETDASNYLSKLKFAMMISGEVRKGDWSVLTDYIYLNFNDQNSRVKNVTGPLGFVSDEVDLGSSSSLRGDVWTLVGGYSAWRSGASHLDVIAGTRYLGLDTSLDWNVAGTSGFLPARQGSISNNRGEWDGIVGVKGVLDLGSEGKWFMPYYLDVGAGSNNTTWQALIGAGYRYGWGEMALTLRNLSYNFSGSNESADIRFTGPALSATFAF